MFKLTVIEKLKNITFTAVLKQHCIVDGLWTWTLVFCCQTFSQNSTGITSPSTVVPNKPTIEK